MLAAGTVSLVSSFVYSSASRKLSQEVTDKIMKYGLYHITSSESADKMIEQGKMYPSGYFGSYSTPGRKSCFFFSGIPNPSDIFWNINNISPEMTVTKITPETLRANPGFVKRLTYRKIDEAIMFKGTSKVPMEKSKLLFIIKNGRPELVEDKNGFGERTEELARSQQYINRYTKRNPLSKFKIYFETKARELNLSFIKRKLLKFNLFNKKNGHEQFKPKDVVSELENNGQLDFLRNELSDGNFNREHFNSSAIHGIAHTERVCFHAAALGYYEKLPQNELRILMDAAKYHDVGRIGNIIGDVFDFGHGRLSVRKIEKANLVQYENKDDLNILKYIVRNHSVNDEKAFANIGKSGIQDVDKARRILQILKDADNLDRVRTFDLNPKFLRTESAKKMIDVATELFVNRDEVIYPKENKTSKSSSPRDNLLLENSLDNEKISEFSDLLSQSIKTGRKISIPKEKVSEIKNALRESMKRDLLSHSRSERETTKNIHNLNKDKIQSSEYSR